MAEFFYLAFFALCYLVVAFIVVTILYDKRLNRVKKEVSKLIDEIENEVNEGDNNGSI